MEGCLNQSLVSYGDSLNGFDHHLLWRPQFNNPRGNTRYLYAIAGSESSTLKPLSHYADLGLDIALEEVAIGFDL